MDRRRVLWLLLLLGMGLPKGARADRRELYALVGYQAGVGRVGAPVGGDAAMTGYAGAVDLSVYYGLSNEFHVGGRLRLSSGSDAHFGGVTARMPDGREAVGDLYADPRSLGLGGLVLYRIDTGYALAPVLELGAGVTVRQYHNIGFVPSGATYVARLGSASDVVFHGSGAVLLEYRFLDRWVAVSGVTVQVETGAFSPWSVLVPLRLGFIW